MIIKLRHLFIALCFHGAIAAVVRKQPAFATPIYSDSYLPASMQVIFHIVDQLKRIEAEELEQDQLLVPSTSPHPPGQKQPLPTNPTTQGAETSTVSDEEKYYVAPERYQEEALIISKPKDTDSQSTSFAGVQATPEVNHEESEVVYGVPETNYELPETNHELPEKAGNVNLPQLIAETSERSDIEEIVDQYSSNCNNFTKLTVDSVVKEIYSIVRTSSNSDNNNSDSNSADIIVPKKLSDRCLEGKNAGVIIDAAEENKERSDELKDDQRFTLIGEKVDQVPRPSLVAFLRANNATSNPSLQQLGDLYDALSRDARRQGFSKYSGYSEKVLEYLVESSGGGAGLQLKGLLKKSQENNELTRYDAQEKTKDIIAVLDDDTSKLSTELRQLLPLRFMP